MPYFSSQGSTLYFASNRSGNGNNPGANGNFAIYQVTYPATGLSGSPGSQTDGASQITQLTSPGSSNDYAPTVSADGAELSFIRCNASTTSCSLYVQSPIVGGTPTLVPTSPVLPALPDAVSGAASRPEIDPADNTQILYVGTDNHIHLVSTTSAFPERDLSSESGYSGQSDEYPDWNPAGTNVIFDRSHVVNVFYGINPTAGTASACQLWSSDPGTEIEPIYAPNDTATASSGSCNPAGNQYVWTKLGGGSNIVLDMGHAVGSPDLLSSLTSNRSNNSQPAWQPVAPFVGAPEVPMAALLPGMGGILLAGAFVLDRQRRRKQQASSIAS
jgi:Tol biopolymer transport system component